MHGIPRLVLFASEEAHFSIFKMASILGLGERNVYTVSCDNVGRMTPSHLEKQIQKALSENAVPFMVIATAGIDHLSLDTKYFNFLLCRVVCLPTSFQ